MFKAWRELTQHNRPKATAEGLDFLQCGSPLTPAGGKIGAAWADTPTPSTPTSPQAKALEAYLTCPGLTPAPPRDAEEDFDPINYAAW